MLSWAIPLRSKNLTNNSKLLGLANAFAGGIFLMLAFGHMLPHSVTVFESIGKDRNIAFKFTLVGYLLVFFIEKIAFDSHALMHEATDDTEANTHSSHAHNGAHTAVKQVTNQQSENAYAGVTLDTSLPPLGTLGVVDRSVAATVIDADDVEVEIFNIYRIKSNLIFSS